MDININYPYKFPLCRQAGSLYWNIFLTRKYILATPEKPVNPLFYLPVDISAKALFGAVFIV